MIYWLLVFRLLIEKINKLIIIYFLDTLIFSSLFLFLPIFQQQIICFYFISFFFHFESFVSFLCLLITFIANHLNMFKTIRAIKSVFKELGNFYCFVSVFFFIHSLCFSPITRLLNWIWIVLVYNNNIIMSPKNKFVFQIFINRDVRINRIWSMIQ